MILKGRKISKGKAVGELLLSHESVSFFGGVDPETGIITEKGHELEGQCIAGKIFAFPNGKGSTVGSYILYRLKKRGLAPLAIINRESEAIVAVGAIISGVPFVDKIDLSKLKTGLLVKVDATQGIVEVD